MSMTLTLSRGPSRLRLFILTQPLGALGGLIILALLLAGVLAPLIAPHDPLAVSLRAALKAPSLVHPFGTDAYGRDILSRIMYGARTAILVGVLASLLGCVIGGFIGILSAYFGGKADMLIQGAMDVLLSFPSMILALVFAAVFPRIQLWGIDFGLITAIAIPMVPKVARVMRSSVLSIKEMPYVDAARVAGYGHGRIILFHIAPSITSPFIIMFTAFIAQAILAEASLSYLGVGSSEPTPSWGLMLAGNAVEYYQRAPWLVIFPGLVISLAVFGFNLLGDALRDWLDPKLKL